MAEIMEFIVWCDIQNVESEDATGTDIMAYLKYLRDNGQQNSTRSINLNILKHYFNYQIHYEKRNDNPAKQIKIRGTRTKKLYPIFTKQELESLYHNYHVPDEADNNSPKNWFRKSQLSRKRNKVILSLMIYQGLATDEVNRLTAADVKLKEGAIYIAGTRKSNERVLELKPHQIMELMEYQLTTREELLQLNEAKGATSFYFLPLSHTSVNNKQNDGVNIWKRLSQDMKAINKKFINFQQVRASVITHWLKQYNLRQVQYMAGHKYVSSTEAYLVNQIEDLQQDIDRFHPISIVTRD